MHQIITGKAARHNSGVRRNLRADCIILIVALKRVQKSDWGKIYDIFPPLSFFSPLDHAIIVLLSETV